MPSMSGTNAASSYSDHKKHPDLTGKGTTSSTTPSSSDTHGTSRNSSDDRAGRQSGSNNMDRGSAGAGADTSRASPSRHSANNQGSDNMGGGSSAIFSQGPKQEEGGERDRHPSKEKDPQGDASTPAMPSMSGTTTATSYSDSAKHKSLSGRSSGGGGDSSKAGITRNPTASNTGSDNMGGGSSAIYSQGPRPGGKEGGSGGSKGDASTPAMPSMSGSNAASMYADQAKKRTLSGKEASASSAGMRTEGGSGRKTAADDPSGSATDHFSGRISALN